MIPPRTLHVEICQRAQWVCEGLGRERDAHTASFEVSK